MWYSKGKSTNDKGTDSEQQGKRDKAGGCEDIRTGSLGKTGATWGKLRQPWKLRKLRFPMDEPQFLGFQGGLSCLGILGQPQAS